MKSTNGARRGFTALELTLVLVVLAVCLVPVLSLGAGTTTQAAFTTGHAHAFLRATQLLELAAGRGFEALARDAAAGVTPVTPAAIGVAAVTIVTEGVTFAELEPGLGRLEATVEWSRPREAKLHRIRLVRIVARPDASWREAAPLSGGSVRLASQTIN